MGTKPTKALNNVFCAARLEASTYNEKLKSRDGAAELLGYASASTISDWELGISIPTPEAVLKMSDLYNAPELVNSYCRNMCPLGYDVPEVKLADIDRIAVKALSSFRKIADTKENLLDIVEDGQITDEEKPRLNEILENLDELTSVAMNLKCWCEKNL